MLRISTVPFSPAFEIALAIQKASGPKLTFWRKEMTENFMPAVEHLKEEVEQFAQQFPLPSVEG